MKVVTLLTHKTKKLVEKHGYLSTSMLTKHELFALKRGNDSGQKIRDIGDEWLQKLSGREPTMDDCMDCPHFPHKCPTCSLGIEIQGSAPEPL
jgi:hypothetical protein